MKLDDLHRELPPIAPKKSRVLVWLLCGSIGLHSLVWWAVARLPDPPAKAPESLTEVQLSDLSLPQKAPEPQATPAIASEAPRLAMSPRAADAPPARPQPAPPNPLFPIQEIAPTAPLVRSERPSQTGVTAKKAVGKAPIVPRPTAASQTQTLVPVPLPNSPRAPDIIPPQPQKPIPTTATPPASDADEARRDATEKGLSTDVSQTSGGASKSGIEKEQRAGSDVADGSVDGPSNNTSSNDVAGDKNARSRNGAANSSGGGGLFGLGSGPFGISGATDKTARPNQTQSDKPAPLASAGKGAAAGRGNGSGNGQGKITGSSGGNSNGAGDKIGAGGGPFGAGGGAGEGPRRIVYILDISYSMEPRFERAKQELRDALGGLQAGESFNIIAFYGNVRAFEPRLVEATPRNIAQGRAFIDSLRLSRYTNLERAFEKAFAAPDVNVVVVITDGVPTYGLGSPDFSDDGLKGNDPDISANFGELAQRVRQLNRSRARIFTVGLTDKQHDKFEAAGLLQRLAAESGGTFVTVRIDARPQPDAR